MAKRAKRGPQPNNPPATNPSIKPPASVPSDSTKRLSTAAAAKDRQEKRKVEERRTQQRYIFGGILVVAVLVVLLFLSANQPAEAPIPTDEIARYVGLERGRDEEGYPRLGSAQAPVRVVEFASFGCPGCAQLHRDVYPTLLERVRAGEISFTYIPLLTGEGNVTGAARVALCADIQNKFWEMHDTLFSWQALYAANAFNQPRLAAGVRALGLDEGAINSCANSDPISGLITKAQGKGVDSTPTVRVNNTPVTDNSLSGITQAIDAALGNRLPVTPVTTDVTAEATSAATVEAETTSAATSGAEATTEATANATADATAEATQAN